MNLSTKIIKLLGNPILESVEGIVPLLINAISNAHNSDILKVARDALLDQGDDYASKLIEMYLSLLVPNFCSVARTYGTYNPDDVFLKIFYSLDNEVKSSGFRTNITGSGGGFSSSGEFRNHYETRLEQISTADEFTLNGYFEGDFENGLSRVSLKVFYTRGTKDKADFRKSSRVSYHVYGSSDMLSNSDLHVIPYEVARLTIGYLMTRVINDYVLYCANRKTID